MDLDKSTFYSEIEADCINKVSMCFEMMAPFLMNNYYYCDKSTAHLQSSINSIFRHNTPFQ